MELLKVPFLPYLLNVTKTGEKTPLFYTVSGVILSLYSSDFTLCTGAFSQKKTSKMVITSTATHPDEQAQSIFSTFASRYVREPIPRYIFPTFS